MHRSDYVTLQLNLVSQGPPPGLRRQGEDPLSRCGCGPLCTVNAYAPQRTPWPETSSDQHWTDPRCRSCRGRRRVSVGSGSGGVARHNMSQHLSQHVPSSTHKGPTCLRKQSTIWSTDWSQPSSAGRKTLSKNRKHCGHTPTNIHLHHGLTLHGSAGSPPYCQR